MEVTERIKLMIVLLIIYVSERGRRSCHLALVFVVVKSANEPETKPTKVFVEKVLF